MKMNKIYLAAAALLTLAACTKEIASTQGCDITIDASIGAMTRVSYSGSVTEFTAGDKIAVYAWTGSASSVPASRVVDGVLNTLGTDGKWTPASQMRWKPGEDAHYFLGVFPAPVAAITDFTSVPYTLDPADYEASDLLVATNFGQGGGGVKSTGGAVPLNFDHAMAKLNVNLKFRSEFGAAAPAVSGVTVTARKTAAVNYLTKTVTATASEVPSPVAIPQASTVAAGYALSFSGLQVPQIGVTRITVSIGGNEYVYTSSADIPLESGKYTTLGLMVGKDKVELASVSVSDWTAGQDLADGEAVLVDPYRGHAFVDMGEVSIGGVTKNLKRATCNVGAENPWDYGDYYAWGETAPKNNYSWSTYKYWVSGDGIWDGSKYNITFNKYCTKDLYWKSTEPLDKKTVLDPEDDVAHVKWGDKWRIPTDEEWEALTSATYYTWTWTDDYLEDGSNHKGRIVTRKNVGGNDPCAGNSIFLPAAGRRDGTDIDGARSYGHYWFSSLDTDIPNLAWGVYFYSAYVHLSSDYRRRGQSVRPVTE